MQLEDTPIQKITIRPTKYFHRHFRPKASSYPNQTINIDRCDKSHKKVMMQEKLIDSSRNVIKIIKDTPRIRHSFEHKRKAKGPMNLNATHQIQIFHADARVNGSFKNQPIRTISSERI